MSYSIEPSKEIWNRADFPTLAFWRKLYRCAEIGVDRGEFACIFLDRFPQCSEYWAIDAYEPYPEMNFDRQADYLMAVTRLERHASRAKLVKMASIEAAKLFEPGSLDFIYVDGSHSYPDVKADIQAWWSKLSPQGILAGHDFDEQPLHEGVRRAVEEFARQIDKTVYITTVEGYVQEREPSWYIYKEGIPGPEWKRC